MAPGDAERAAALLLDARRDRAPLAALPEDLRPASTEAAYAVQEAVERARGDAGAAGAGYKIGASSARAQAFLGVTKPFAGRIFTDSLYDSPAALPASESLFRLTEPEFAFRFAAELPASAAARPPEAVAAAVGALHPAIELVDSAFGLAWTEVGGAALIADNGAHGALVLGPGRARWQELDLAAHAVSLAVNGRVAGSGEGANALGGPLKALTWLVNHLAARGRGIAAGDVVTTGVVTEFAYLEAGDLARADFGCLGTVEVQIT